MDPPRTSPFKVALDFYDLSAQGRHLPDGSFANRNPCTVVRSNRLEGTIEIELRDGTVSVGPGEFYIVPKGVEHRVIPRGAVKELLFTK